MVISKHLHSFVTTKNLIKKLRVWEGALLNFNGLILRWQNCSRMQTIHNNCLIRLLSQIMHFKVINRVVKIIHSAIHCDWLTGSTSDPHLLVDANQKANISPCAMSCTDSAMVRQRERGRGGVGRKYGFLTNKECQRSVRVSPLLFCS